MIAIVNYSVGNLYSIVRACQRIGLDVEITDDLARLKIAKALILPGVGTFDSAIKTLQIRGIFEFISQTTKPILGICLGMQLLFERSDEGNLQGLSKIKGTVAKLPTQRLPHIGWNTLKFFPNKHPLFDSINDNEFFYFVHSYYCVPTDKGINLALTEYDGFEFCAAVCDGNVFGVQFHPEKSKQQGLKVLKNFWLCRNL